MNNKARGNNDLYIEDKKMLIDSVCLSEPHGRCFTVLVPAVGIRLIRRQEGGIGEGGFEGICFNLTLETKHLDFTLARAVLFLYYERI